MLPVDTLPALLLLVTLGLDGILMEKKHINNISVIQKEKIKQTPTFIIYPLHQT
jgi:hypothetical protein